MKYVFIILFSLLSNSVNAQNINEQLRRIKLSMLPETTLRFPCGDSVGHGYYIAKGFQEEHSYFGKHLGIDISGIGKGNSDLGDTIYSIGYGMVAFAYSDEYLAVYYKYNGELLKAVYYHCDTVFCKTGELVPKGFPIATIGNSNGAYLAHLHFEMIKDTSIYFGGYGDLHDYSEPDAPLLFYDPEPLLPHYKKIKDNQ